MTIEVPVIVKVSWVEKTFSQLSDPEKITLDYIKTHGFEAEAYDKMKGEVLRLESDGFKFKEINVSKSLKKLARGLEYRDRHAW